MSWKTGAAIADEINWPLTLALLGRVVMIDGSDWQLVYVHYGGMLTCEKMLALDESGPRVSRLFSDSALEAEVARCYVVRESAGYVFVGATELPPRFVGVTGASTSAYYPPSQSRRFARPLVDEVPRRRRSVRETMAEGNAREALADLASARDRATRKRKK